MRAFSVVACCFCVASCGGVDFDAVVDGNVFGRSGSLLGQSATVLVDFSDPDTVSLSAEASSGDTVTDTADGTCDRAGPPEEGLSETRLPADNCVFVFEVTTTEEPEDPPSSIVIGFRNAEADGSVEIDPSLEEDLPFPLSFADDYARLDVVD